MKTITHNASNSQLTVMCRSLRSHGFAVTRDSSQGTMKALFNNKEAVVALRIRQNSWIIRAVEGVLSGY